MTQEQPQNTDQTSLGLSSQAPHSLLGNRQMGAFDHLDELRQRLTRCLGVFFAGFLICYLVSDQIMEFLKRPLFRVLPPDQQKLYFTSLFENFLVHLKVSGYASLVFFSPFYFFQIWGFISPGLYEKEKKLVTPFFLAAAFFFLCGASFAYFVLFPVGFKYFMTYGSVTDVALITIENYYSTCLKLLFLFGVSFELPVVICILGVLGLIDAPTLRQHRRTAIITITIVAAFVAPPDAISMLMLGTPLVLLYEASIFVVQWMGVKKTKQNEPSSVPPYDPFNGASR